MADVTKYDSSPQSQLKIW